MSLVHISGVSFKRGSTVAEQHVHVPVGVTIAETSVLAVVNLQEECTAPHLDLVEELALRFLQLLFPSFLVGHLGAVQLYGLLARWKRV